MRHVLGIVAATLLVVACGGDGDGDGDGEASGTSTTGPDSATGGEAGDADDYVAAMTDSMAEDIDDRQTASCMATAIVDLVGEDALQEAQVSPSELADADSLADVDVEVPDDGATRLAGDLADCDVTDMAVDALLQEIGAQIEGGLPEDATECFREAIDNQDAPQAVAEGFVEGSDESFRTLIGESVAACPQVMTAVIVAQAPIELTPEDEACIESVVETNSDLVRGGLVDRNPDATRELGGLVASECPGVAAGLGS